MNAERRRIVITGIGAVTPLGTGNDAFWQGLQGQKSGVMPIQAFRTNGIAAGIAAEVRDFDPKNFVKQRKSLKVMARDIQLGVGAAHLCVDDSGLDHTKVDATRFGVNCGASMIASELQELGSPVEHSINGNKKFDLKKWGSEGIEQLFPLWMLKYLPNMPACHISIFYDAQGPNNSITAGEASATLAMGEAFRVMTRDSADVFITGGADSKINPLAIIRLILMDRISRRLDDPSNASRPFDADRDGMVPGEGSGLMLFEELEHARRRNAKIYGEVVGFGAACHPKNHGIAIEKAVARALDDAGVKLSDLGHIVPSGNSCKEDDHVEAIALANILGDLAESMPIVPYKSMLGHTAAASGAIELIASLLSMKHGMLIGSPNFKKPDADAPKLRILTETIDYPNKPFLTYDVSHSGQCGALVVRPFVLD